MNAKEMIEWLKNMVNPDTEILVLDEKERRDIEIEQLIRNDTDNKAIIVLKE